MTDKIRNPQAFVKAYLNSDNGKRALTRTSYRDKKTGENVYRSSQMAEAFAASIGVVAAQPVPQLLTPAETRKLYQSQQASVFFDAEGKKQQVPDMMKRKGR